MFQYQLDFWRHLKGEHLRIIGNMILFWLMIMVIGAIAVFSYIASLFIGGALAESADSPALFILGVIVGALLFIVVEIFIFIPLAYGFINYYFLSYKRGSPEFGDGFFAFKKGVYLKSLGLIILLSIISFVIQIGINLVFSAITSGLIASNDTMNSIGFLIFSGILALLMSIISIVLSIAIQGFILSAWYRHLETPFNTFGEKIKIGYRIVFENMGKYLKLIVSNVLISIMIGLVAIILVGIGALILSQGVELTIFVIYTVIMGLLFLIFSIFFAYISYGAYSAFYFDSKRTLFDDGDASL